MIKTTDECVNCGLPCLGELCQNRNVRHLVCDKCGDEADRLYILDGEELCEGCLLKQFKTIK